MHEIIENRYMKYMSFFVVPIGFVADAMGSSWYFFSAFLCVVIFFVLAILDNKKMKKLYKESIIRIPIVINVDHTKPTKHVFDSLIEEIERKYSLKNYEENLQKYLGITREDLIFKYNGSIFDKERMESFLQIIRHELNKLEINTKNKIEVHLAYYGKPAIGFLVGSIFKDDALVVYQNNPDEDRFDRVAQTYKRNYKTKVTEFTKFHIEESIDEPANELLVAIEASSHSLTYTAPGLAKFKNIIKMRAKHDGTIKLDEDWVLYAQEIFSILDANQSKKITIAHAMPEAIAVLVGMGIGNYWDIQMTQFDSMDYKQLIKLDEVKFYF